MAVGVLVAPAVAAADAPDAERFRLAPHGDDVLSVYAAAPTPHLQLALGAMVHISDDPLVLRDGDGNVAGRLIDSRVVTDVAVSLGLADRLELAMGIPFLVNQQRDAPTGFDASEVRSGGVGDAQVSGKLLLHRQGALRASVVVPITFPTGDSASYFGGEYAIAPTVVGEYRWPGGARVIANAGVNFRRTRQFADLEAGTEVVYGAAAQVPVRVGGAPLTLAATLFGAVDVEQASGRTAPLEAAVAVDYTGIEGLALTVGGGPGLSRGYGTPDLRVLAGLRYRPRIAGVAGCAFGSEDYDGFEDGDGCAEPDNDGDGIDDAADVCPNEPETRNGIRDEDGCPEQVAAVVGGAAVPSPEPLPAPVQPADPDEDGVVGDDDGCPDQPEDKDGFEDDDGCPELDNDGDGIADAADRCPLAAESNNGFQDGDGCPDVLPPELARYAGKVVGVRFGLNSSVLLPVSRAVLDKAARVLVAFPAVTVEVSGHTDSLGARDKNVALSLARANAVRAYLVRKGVAGARISAVGHGPDKPVADNGTNAGRAKNRRVEFRLVSTIPSPSSPPSPGATP